MDPAMLLRIAILISVTLIVVALGLRYALGDAAYLLHRPSLLVRSLVAMNVIMPLMAVWLVSSFDFKTPVKVALVALDPTSMKLACTAQSSFYFGARSPPSRAVTIRAVARRLF